MINISFNPLNIDLFHILNRFRLYFLVSLGLLLCTTPQISQAQLNEMGFHASLIGSRYTLSNNFPNNQIIISQGKLFPGFALGGQWSFGPPRDQYTPYLKLEHGFMVEASFCRCGGNINYFSRPSGVPGTFSELTYVSYQGDYTASYVAHLKKLYGLWGVSVTNYFFRGVKVGASNEFKSSKGQLNDIYFSASVGLGVRLDQFLITGRYNLAITEFSQETALIPVSMNSHQIKFTFAYFMFEKHVGKNWDSIYLK